MSTSDLGELLVERAYTAHHSDGKTYPVLLRIGLPRPDPEPGGDWYCPHQLVGLGDGAVRPVFGLDALQALQLTQTVVRDLLHANAAAEGIRVTWLNDDDLGLG